MTNKTDNNKQKFSWISSSVLFVTCFFVRLLPFRPPNVEPLLTAQMPLAKAHGKLLGFVFGFSSIVLYDIVTARVGIWTLITAVAYGLMGVWATAYFKNKENTGRNYALFAVMATIAYDAVTGLTIGPLFFHESFMTAFIGQIPFTALHLLGNVSFAFVLSPVIYSVLVRKRQTTHNLITKPLFKTL